MKRILPFPLLSATLFTMWVLLTGFSPGHIVIGAAVAVIVSRVMLALQPEPSNIRISSAIPRLAGLVFVDILRSNIAVARIVLFKPKERKSGFIHLPIELQNPYALATLAVIMTATPGTLWLQHDARNRRVLIHVLDLVDESEWVDLIKNRYERLLMEIFE
ncbi:Na+/H+ antiporter subunit E [Altererythrobacter xixiisoli]|uniref:Na+/H+ antiporter subunit E n=1 Tax=Croceibacterium xixiisoli TaxID=1476466 RepID=A0A6I4TZ23_9SPHN|nr:Na+/H+ antiporter subunit E [Croceibacterium xixiisoli]MXP00312.1 Na+/H+ antiporter subunit E [Croceibacterium xixiisoli]